MYSYAIRMSLVCTRISSVWDSYVVSPWTVLKAQFSSGFTAIGNAITLENECFRRYWRYIQSELYGYIPKMIDLEIFLEKVFSCISKSMSKKSQVEQRKRCCDFVNRVDIFLHEHGLTDIGERKFKKGTAFWDIVMGLGSFHLLMVNQIWHILTY